MSKPCTMFVNRVGFKVSDYKFERKIPRKKAEVEGSEWLKCLESRDKFSFDDFPNLKFTAYRSRGGYWSAQRRVEGKLRHEYLGSSSDLTADILVAAAKLLALPPDVYEIHKDYQKSHKNEHETKSSYLFALHLIDEYIALNACDFDDVAKYLFKTFRQWVTREAATNLKQRPVRKGSAMPKGGSGK
ncbi:MAG: hypothetical protein F6K10_32780 [Moorea sp. SIO2B7]|nr:hypothetical protein [Moorena sp. SIO2B7]